MEWYEVALWSLFLCAFSIWFTILSKKLESGLEEIGITDEKITDIEEAVLQVVQILNTLPQMMPQFHMNNNPLTPIIEMIRDRYQSGQPSIAESALRDDSGRFSDGTGQEKETV